MPTTRKHYEANREKIAAQTKLYKEVNAEKVAAFRKAYYEANYEIIAAKKKAIYKNNPDRTLTKPIVRYALKQRLGFRPTDEMVESHLAVLKVKRLVRELSK